MSDQFENIDQYLRGELSGEEAAGFEKELESDPLLRDKVDQHRQIIEGLQAGFSRELKEILQDEEKRLSEKSSTSKRRPLYPIIGIAAVVSLIIASYFVLNSSPNTEELFQEYYSVYPNIESPVLRSGMQEDNPFAAYEQANYQVALDRFKALLIDDPQNASLHFYSGICLLELDQPVQAIKEFQSAHQLPDTSFQRPAEWYEALAHLRNGDLSKAKIKLRNLEGGQDLYASKAKDLLNNL
jgi:tetratricopeptide (TPR) repeat protein